MINSITKAETPSVSPAFAKQLLAAVRAIKERLHKWQDERLAQKLVERLYSLERWQWLPVDNSFNSWEFPREFYDLIPKWWKPGERASRVMRPLRNIVRKEFGNKEQLRYHNVFLGKMTDSEFEYWYSLDENNLDIAPYYDKRVNIEKICWWDEDVYKKLSELNVW